MAITDCRLWGVTEGAFDGAQLAGFYTARFQVIANAVHGPLQLIALCELFANGGALDPAKIPVPKKWATYDFRAALTNAAEVDKASFVKRRYAQLRDVESGFYNWWVDVFYERLEPGEIPPLDDEGNLITQPYATGNAPGWPVVYRLDTFTVGRDQDMGIPAEAKVRDLNGTTWTVTDIGFVEDFQNLPNEPQSERRIPITNQAGELPDRFQRDNYTLPMLVAECYVPDLYTFYKDIARAKNTANKDVFFNQKPGFAKFRDGRILGGRIYESQGPGNLSPIVAYKVQYRWELWGDPSDLSSGDLKNEGSTQTADSKEIEIAAVLVANEGLNAWSAAAPSGDLQPIVLTGSNGDDQLVGAPWPLNEDGTAKAQTDATTIETYKWWVLYPYDYTKMAGGQIGKFWPTYDYNPVPERA